MMVKAREAQVSPLDCQADEYQDDHGKCVPCKECSPGFELSQECGFGEGREARCTPCPPRRFKDGWSHQGCKPCFSCKLINRAQKVNCTATSDATCGECSPGFYSKTQVGGLQDLECVPCTKQTPSSEEQCLSGLHLAENTPDPGQGLALVALMSCALVLLGLVLLAFSILYCRRFWKSRCQRGFLGCRSDASQRVAFRASVLPPAFLSPDLGSLDCQSFGPPHRPMAGAAQALPLAPGVGLHGFHLPLREPGLDLTKPEEATSKPLLEAQPLTWNPAGGSSLAESRQGCSRDPRPGGTARLSSCARELQHCWPHTPVECTELDLQTFSTQIGKAELPGHLEPPPKCKRALSSWASGCLLELADQDSSCQGSDGLSHVEELAALAEDLRVCPPTASTPARVSECPPLGNRTGGPVPPAEPDVGVPAASCLHSQFWKPPTL